ncbi:HEAT repeat domain-containing protein [Haliangium ochraceum]|uniref:PBS lyase HEAT domain protein repeat-containing protein n=1 Tax=Haliangium ochraceum (strain DSM 14365 / JCM 11303 / SMP-2) TaxID=502025 RepID=D0LY62_HALO1|nr:HEAT repeat domain-containing protein [Haliangium ochraceum]ACY16212.1 PBS lyase HEAT domain protein repeat-containing protein [Haliangium ochraceum DSM 14365]
MNFRKLTKPILLATAVASVLALSSSALAGRGGSHSRIQNAIISGSAEALISEIERAERLVCSSACIATMMALLEDGRYEVREAAAWWFARRPAQKAELTERSLAFLSGSDSTAARNAADILGAFRHPLAVPALADAAVRQDLSAEARQHAVRSLGLIRATTGKAAVAEAMSDPDASVRLEAAAAWLIMRDQQDAAPVVALLDDDDVLVRRKAAAVAGKLREASARAALESLAVSDEDALVRRHAAWALGQIGDPASRPALESARDDASAIVRGVARAALRDLR